MAKAAKKAAKKVAVKKAAPKKAAAKKATPKKVAVKKVVLRAKSGDYFSATYNGKKIRGRVSDVSGDYGLSWEKTYFLGNKSEGEYIDDHECYEFSKAVRVEWDKDEANFEIGLKDAGVTNFKILTDRREKRVIDNDILPEIAGYRISVNDDGTFEFGCGAIKVNKDQIRSFLAIAELIDEDDWSEFMSLVDEMKSEGVELEDVELDRVRQLLDY